MSPDDPRHGTTAGHNAGCRCLPCRRAKLRYDKQRRADELSGKPRRVPAWRVARRLEALQALGWPLRRLGAETGIRFNHLNLIRDRETVTLATFRAVDEAYERLCMSSPPMLTPGQRSGITRTRKSAAARGFLPPLAWTNIDDVNESPTDWQYRPPTRAELLADLDRQGAGISVACEALHVSRDSLQQWCGRTGHSDIYRRMTARETVAGRVNQHTMERGGYAA